MDVKASLGFIVLVACSGKTSAPKTAVEDARGSAVAQVADAAVPAPGGKGDVQVRVEWKDVPPEARAAPGRTPCGTARPAAVAPTTLWGIPDVFVAIEVAGTATRAAQRVSVAPCALSPRISITGTTLSIASEIETPAKVFVQHAGQLPLGGTIQDERPRAVYLPTAGHEVQVALDDGTIARVIAGSEDAWIVATDSAFVAITEAGGNVIMRDVPTGSHAVTAWLPARSGQSARVARGKVTVNPGALAEVTLDLTKQ